MSHPSGHPRPAVTIALLCGVWAAVLFFCLPPAAQAAAPDPAGDHEAAQALIRQQRYPEALALLEPYAGDPARHPVHTSDYLVALYLSGQAQAALGLYELLPGAFPRRDYLLLNMAKAYLDVGDHRQATAQLLELLRRGALDPETTRAMARLPKAGQEMLLDHARLDMENGAPGAGGRLVTLARLFGGDAGVVEAIRRYKIRPETFTQDQAIQLAWVCVTQKDGETALGLYNAVLERAPGRFEARNGRVYALALTRKFDQAHGEADRLEREYPGNLQVLYGRAYAFEQERRFIDAIKVYERMLGISPGNEVVERLRVRAYSDMGASLHAKDEAGKLFPEDQKLRASIEGDYALDTIAWEEPKEAAAIYDALNASPETVDNRYLLDELFALGRAEQHARAVERYEALREERPELKVPHWIKSSVAGSYLYMEKPDEALALYDEALEAQPDSRIALRGRLDTLVELRKWREAAELRDKFDEKTPDYAQRGKSRAYSADQLSLDISRGWGLMYENRYRDAEKYWQDLYEKAPANLEVRNARAYLHSWRGWPRQAQEDFAILASMDPEHRDSKTGRIAVKNAIGDKKEAREEAEALLEEQPEDKRTQMLIRELQIEEMSHNRLEGRYVAEDDGSRDWWIHDEISTPLSLYTRLHAMYLIRRTWNEDRDDEPLYLRRAGLGLSHIFNEDWSAKQMFSVSTDDGEDFGSATELSWTPDDHWRVGGLYDTFFTDIAHQARRRGVTAKRAALSTGYRESEWRDYHLGLSRQFFSDDNDRDEISLGYEQNLFVRNDWRMRLFADLYGSWNSEWDNPEIDYFNPKHIWSAALTLMTEQTVYDAYQDYFAHRLYLTLGLQKQYDYNERLIHAVKYEHEYTLTHQQHLVWNVEYRQTYYDDDRTDSIGANLIWNMRF